MAEPQQAPETDAVPSTTPAPDSPANKPREVGGPKGPEPTRYNDWERGGRCIDF